MQVFANGGAVVMTTRVYPTLVDSLLARLSTSNAEAVVNIDYYEMNTAAIQFAT